MTIKKPSARGFGEDMTISKLIARVQYLEEINRATLDALDMITSQDDSYPSINKLDSPQPIIADTLRRAGLLIPFKSMAVCFVDERDADFRLLFVEPRSWYDRMEKEMETMIRNEVFGWSLREKRPVIVPSSDGSRRFLLHVMATTSRIRGMFLGFLSPNADEIPDVNWSLFSIVLQRSANALESFELYRIIKQSDIQLQEQVKERFPAPRKHFRTPPCFLPRIDDHDN